MDNINIRELVVYALHLWTFKTPTSSAVMNDKGVADWAFEMPNGVKSHTKRRFTPLFPIC